MALFLAQEFLPTDFDWRIGVFGGEPLYACRYLMAGGHWQIIKQTRSGKFRYVVSHVAGDRSREVAHA